MKRIYADNAATTRTSDIAARVMLENMMEFFGNPSSLHTSGQRAAEVLEKARTEAAEIIGAEPREITFTSGGSESDNQAIISAAEIGAKKGKKHIVSTAFEHHAVLHTFDKLKKDGFEITLVDVGTDGIVNPADIADAIREDTALVSVMYANNEIGTIQPISEIGAICREKKVLFHTDAVQAFGNVPINVENDHIDMLSISGHKFHGPKGVGLLYAKRGIKLTNVIHGGAQERGKRAGTENLPGIVGMVQAMKDAAANLEKHSQDLIPKRDRLIDGLAQISHSALNGDRENRLPGNVSMCFEGIEGESLLLLLDDRGIEASSGSACTSGSLDPSHVLLAIGRIHEIAHGSLRLTIDESVTAEDIEYMIKNIGEVVDYLRSISPLWNEKISGKRAFHL